MSIAVEVSSVSALAMNVITRAFIITEELNRFDQILKHPNGIILVTGPTGSGKSTTLYTALSELNLEDL